MSHDLVGMSSTSDSGLHFSSPVGADLHRLQLEITSLSARARETRSRSDYRRVAKLKKQRDALHAPVHKLPDDVLSEIFTIGLADSPMPIQFSLRVSWAVSRWRRIALATPALWSDFNIAARGNGAVFVISQGWKTFVERSAARPLTLTIKLHSLRFDDSIVPIHSLLPRCTDLRISSDLSLSRLDGLSLISPSASLLPYPMNKLRLHKVGLESCSQLLTLLRSCPRLRDMFLDAVHFRHDDIDPADDPLELPELLSLRLRDIILRNPRGRWPLLRYVRAPMLQSLTVHDSSFLRRPSIANLSSLTSLNIGRCHLSDMELVEIMGAMPLLKHLSLFVLARMGTQAELPLSVPVPPLETVDFCCSENMDSFALWLVQNCPRDERGARTVKVVSAKADEEDWENMSAVAVTGTIDEDLKWEKMTTSTLELIRECVPLVKSNRNCDPLLHRH